MNTTLKRSEQIPEYIELCRAAGYVHRSDRTKNWDNFKAVTWILENHKDLDGPILDAGGIQESAFLPTLDRFGYRRLIALDLGNPQPPKLVHNITFRRGDITDTKYPDNFFQAVGCLSVIEHGVDPKLFFTEMKRIIKPGGSLIVSTDYWADKVQNVDGRQAYGVPVHIFSRQEMDDVIRIAAEHGFELTSEKVDFDCEEKTVNWCGFQYTFIIVCFRKK